MEIKNQSVQTAQRIPVHISGQDVADTPCELVGIDAGILYVRSERQIAESTSILVALDQVQLSGAVAACQPHENDWVISIALSSCKRRLAERIPHGQESVVAVIECGRADLRPCTIIDASPYGVGLRLSFPLAVGTRVCVETDANMIFGEVRHCHPKYDGKFIAGILIIDVVPDVRTESPFAVALNNLRWKLARSIRGKDVPAYRADR